MTRSIRPTLVAIALGFAISIGSGVAQGQGATLTAVGGANFAGQSVAVDIVVECSDVIDGVSLGLSHDPTQLSINTVVPGDAFEQPPAFFDVDVTPIGGSGFTVGMVSSFDFSVRLAAATPHTVLVATYIIDPTVPSPSMIDVLPTGTLGSPPVQLLVASGILELVPTTAATPIQVLGPDCNGNLVIDAEDIAVGTSLDCDLDGVPDECALAAGLVTDCDGDGVIDACDPDCDANGLSDVCQVLADPSIDCDGNGVPDSCDLLDPSRDCDADGLLDACETDCDGNGVADHCEILLAPSLDCDGSGTLDTCDLLIAGVDTNLDGRLDVCETRFLRGDCNGSGSVNLADAYAMLIRLFQDPTIVECAAACESNGDCVLELPDVLHLLAYLFDGGSAPPEPFGICGIDGGGCALECPTFGACPEPPG